MLKKDPSTNSDTMRKYKTNIEEFIVPVEKQVNVPTNTSTHIRHGKAQWVGHRRFLNNVPGQDRI